MFFWAQCNLLTQRSVRNIFFWLFLLVLFAFSSLSLFENKRNGRRETTDVVRRWKRRWFPPKILDKSKNSRRKRRIFLRRNAEFPDEFRRKNLTERKLRRRWDMCVEMSHRRKIESMNEKRRRRRRRNRIVWRQKFPREELLTRRNLMIELSSASSTSTFPSMGLVSSPQRPVCPTTSSNASGIRPTPSPTRLTKFPCQDLEKLKHKFRLQHTSCLTQIQILIQKHRVTKKFGGKMTKFHVEMIFQISKCRDCASDGQMSRLSGMFVVLLSNAFRRTRPNRFASVGHRHQTFVRPLLRLSRCSIRSGVRTGEEKNSFSQRQSNEKFSLQRRNLRHLESGKHVFHEQRSPSICPRTRFDDNEESFFSSQKFVFSSSRLFFIRQAKPLWFDASSEQLYHVSTASIVPSRSFSQEREEKVGHDGSFRFTKIKRATNLLFHRNCCI